MLFPTRGEGKTQMRNLSIRKALRSFSSALIHVRSCAAGKLFFRPADVTEYDAQRVYSTSAHSNRASRRKSESHSSASSAVTAATGLHSHSGAWLRLAASVRAASASPARLRPTPSTRLFSTFGAFAAAARHAPPPRTFSAKHAHTGSGGRVEISAGRFPIKCERHQKR